MQAHPSRPYYPLLLTDHPTPRTAQRPSAPASRQWSAARDRATCRPFASAPAAAARATAPAPPPPPWGHACRAASAAPAARQRRAGGAQQRRGSGGPWRARWARGRGRRGCQSLGALSPPRLPGRFEAPSGSSGSWESSTGSRARHPAAGGGGQRSDRLARSRRGREARGPCADRQAGARAWRRGRTCTAPCAARAVRPWVACFHAGALASADASPAASSVAWSAGDSAWSWGRPALSEGGAADTPQRPRTPPPRARRARARRNAPGGGVARRLAAGWSGGYHPQGARGSALGRASRRTAPRPPRGSS